MENVTLLRCDNFTPSQIFFKNFNHCKSTLKNEKCVEGKPSVADFLLHVRGFFTVHNI